METKQTFWQTVVCPACLCVNRKLENITDHKAKEFYLNTLCEIPFYELSVKEILICWECVALLKKAVAFREQVKDSYRVLQSYTKEDLLDRLLSDVSRPPRLIIRSFSPVDIISHDETVIDNYEVKIEENPLETRKEHRRTYSTDVKSESENSEISGSPNSLNNEELCTSLNNEDKYDSKDVITSYEQAVFAREHIESHCGVDNVKIKKDRAKRSRVDKVKKITKRKLGKNTKVDLDGKIRTVELSYDQVLSERTEDSQREAFLKASFKCETCIVGFDCENDYKEHNNDKHSISKGDYNCPICKIVFESVEAFTSHYKLHIRRYECGSCDIRMVDKKSMKLHYYTIHQGSKLTKEYKCNFCGKLSNTIDAHRYHKDTHKKRAECKDCDKTFSHRSGLMNHRLTVHKKNRGFPCSVCDKMFRWKASMKRHMEKHEDRKNEDQDSSPYCDQCNVHFSSLCSYKRHMKNSLKHVTENELKYICADCNRKFSNKTKLRDHIEEKHLRKTYQCHICLKPSKNRVCLDQHIRNVHNGRPRNKICHHCGKGFPTRVQLESHIRSHTGEKPFICEYCPTTFSQKSNLYKHNRQVHMNIKAKRYAVCRKRKDRQDGLEQEFSVTRTLPNVHFSHDRDYVI